jgi:hypothetical protein
MQLQIRGEKFDFSPGFHYQPIQHPFLLQFTAVFFLAKLRFRMITAIGFVD